ncbi:MAG: hypothetical protein R2710_05235 [Acidimicrobiales bacterium]
MLIGAATGDADAEQPDGGGSRSARPSRLAYVDQSTTSSIDLTASADAITRKHDVLEVGGREINGRA